MGANRLAPGDSVVIREPGAWDRAGVVVEVDDRPAGVESAVKVRWGHDTPGGAREEWFAARHVFTSKAGARWTT